ncbi:MAG: toast rack family protein, partial [Bacillota bacterium]
MNLGKLFWGLAFLVFGFLFLLVNYNVLDSSVFSQIWKLWPLVIVVMGFSILSKGSSKIVRIISGIVIAILVLAGLYIAILPAVQCTSGTCIIEPSAQTTIISEPIQEKAQKAEITLETGAGNLQVEGGSNLLVEGDIANNTSEPKIVRSFEQNTDKVTISNTFTKNIFWGKAFDNNWNIKLNKELPLDLILKSGAIDAEIDLKNTNLKNLKIEGGASSLDITFPKPEERQKAEISAGASSITLKVPENIALNIEEEAGLGTNNFEE